MKQEMKKGVKQGQEEEEEEEEEEVKKKEEAEKEEKEEVKKDEEEMKEEVKEKLGSDGSSLDHLADAAGAERRHACLEEGSVGDDVAQQVVLRHHLQHLHPFVQTPGCDLEDEDQDDWRRSKGRSSSRSIGGSQQGHKLELEQRQEQEQ